MVCVVLCLSALLGAPKYELCHLPEEHSGTPKTPKRQCEALLSSEQGFGGATWRMPVILQAPSEVSMGPGTYPSELRIPIVTNRACHFHMALHSTAPAPEPRDYCYYDYDNDYEYDYDDSYCHYYYYYYDYYYYHYYYY